MPQQSARSQGQPFQGFVSKCNRCYIFQRVQHSSSIDIEDPTAHITRSAAPPNVVAGYTAAGTAMDRKLSSRASCHTEPMTAIINHRLIDSTSARRAHASSREWLGNARAAVERTSRADKSSACAAAHSRRPTQLLRSPPGSSMNGQSGTASDLYTSRVYRKSHPGRCTGGARVREQHLNWSTRGDALN